MLSAKDVATALGCSLPGVWRRARTLGIGKRIGTTMVFTQADLKRLAPRQRGYHGHRSILSK